MNLFQKTKELCKVYNIKPVRSRGQNFLIKEDVYNSIIEAAELKNSDVVLEVGPGLGFLTSKLAKRVKKVIAVELDDKLAEVLRIELETREIKNVEVVNENVLDYQLEAIASGEHCKIVANLPYNITSVFLRKFLSSKCKPSLMVLMLQKEVAERIASKPPRMSLLAVSVQFYAKPEIIEIVPKDNFWPEPSVDSAIVKIQIRKGIFKEASKEKDFFRLVKIGFSSKRKMLKNNLAVGFHITHKEAENKLEKAGFNPKIRAQELSIENWKELLSYF